MIKAVSTSWNFLSRVSKSYIDEAKKTIQKRDHDIPEEDRSIIEKLLAIDEKVATMMANEMLLAGIDTVSKKIIYKLRHFLYFKS